MLRLRLGGLGSRQLFVAMCIKMLSRLNSSTGRRKLSREDLMQVKLREISAATSCKFLGRAAQHPEFQVGTASDWLHHNAAWLCSKFRVVSSPRPDCLGRVTFDTTPMI